MNTLDQDGILAINRAGWDKVAHSFGGTALPHYGPLAATEETLGLLDLLVGKRVLELGCGSGHSLQYLAQHGATELWGLDLAATQIAFATTLLEDYGSAVHLFQSPMEENPGIPESYFDVVVSIYALGWSANLTQTLSHVVRYLKPNGCFVFSWEHPIYHCLDYEAGHFVMRRSYQEEGPQAVDQWKGVPIIMYPRKISTYVNALIAAGLVIERLLEADLDIHLAQGSNVSPEAWYSIPRATLVPTTMIIKARKPANA
ncbi:MAG: class I SAM-dependent methyltransferase [Herpetosiphonaceae bacterium]|nr:class I SAM-dependent methyltransferase [Herpetosiphonaceae bacterium]